MRRTTVFDSSKNLIKSLILDVIVFLEPSNGLLKLSEQLSVIIFFLSKTNFYFLPCRVIINWSTNPFGLSATLRASKYIFLRDLAKNLER